jgi:hypothetical protein
VAGALPAEEYKAKLERSGFTDVNVTITKTHEPNPEILKRTIEALSPEELGAMEGVSASALIMAVK